MPTYMDRHDLEGTTADEIASAHKLDIEVQERYDVEYLTYWYDHRRQQAFCLVTAPTKQAAIQVHQESHGLVAGAIKEVDPETVEAFLGRTADPEWAVQRPIDESAFRTLLFTDMVASTDLHSRVGDAAALELVRQHDRLIRGALEAHHGSEVKHTGDGFLASFSSAADAVACAAEIQRSFTDQANPDLQVRIGLNAGEPIVEAGQIFGLVVNLASRICDAAGAGQVLVSEAVRGITLGKGFDYDDLGDREFKGFDHPIRVSELIWSHG